jgi:hypothetical protein
MPVDSITPTKFAEVKQKSSGRTTTPILDSLTPVAEQITAFQRIHARCFPDARPLTRSEAKLSLETYLWELHLWGELLSPNPELEQWLRQSSTSGAEQ